MKRASLIIALLAAPLGGCIYNGSGSSIVSMAMVHRLLPEATASQARESEAAPIAKADPALNHLIYRAPADQASHPSQVGAMIQAALKQAKRRTDRELCGGSHPLRAQIVEEVGPTLSRTTQGEGWFFRLSWKGDGNAVCDSVEPDHYYLTFSRHLPASMLIYQAAPGDGRNPTIYRSGERVDDLLTLIDVG